MMSQTLQSFLKAGAAIVLTVLCAVCSRDSGGAGVAVDLSERGRDTILFDTVVYINDTFTFAHESEESEEIDEIRWTLNNASAGSGRTFSFVSHDIADTGDKIIVGFIFYTDGTIDTERILLNLAAGYPRVHLTLADSTKPDTLFTDSLYRFFAIPDDPNGSIIACLWDFDHDGVFEDTSAADTLSRSFPTAGAAMFIVRVLDDDSLFSAADTFAVHLSMGAPQVNVFFDPSIVGNQIYIGQQISFVASAKDPNGALISLMWDTTGDAVFDCVIALDTSLFSDTIILSFTDSGHYAVAARVRDNDSLYSETKTLVFVVRRGEPSINSLLFTGYFSDLDSLLIDTVYDIAAVARDLNGVVRALFWDMDGDGVFDDTVTADTSWLNDTQQRAFTIPGVYRIAVMAMDNDSFLSMIDSIVFTVHARNPDTMVYLFDTLALAAHPASGKTIGSMTWVQWPGILLSNADTCSFSVSDPADTGVKTIVARILYTDATFDTERVIVQVLSGRPEVFLASDGQGGMAFRDSLYTLTATATDVNGFIQSFRWDINSDGTDDYVHAVSGAQQGSVAVDSLTITFSFNGSALVSVRAVDDDSLVSSAASTILFVQDAVASKRRVSSGR